MIKAIVFDFDGTLSNRQRCAYNKYKNDIVTLMPQLKNDPIKMEGILQQCLTWDQYGTINKRFVYEQLITKYKLDASMIDVMVDRWYDDFHLYNELFSGSIDLLKRLKEKYLLGIITNGDSRCQHLKLDVTGVREYMDSIIVSGDKGIHKPDVAIFEDMASSLNIELSEMIYVGDTYINDIMGSQLAGCHSIWLWTDPYRVVPEGVYRILTLDDVESVIALIDKANDTTTNKGA